MPPEPFPWDRKDCYRERKHLNGGYDRTSEPYVGSVSRWRDSPSHGSRNDFRWGYPPELRRPPGHGKQGGWHLHPDDSPHGYSAPRSGDRFYQDGGGFKPSGPYRDGRYNRNFRENRGCYNQKSWRSNSWDYNNQRSIMPNGAGRSYEGKDLKFVDGPSARISHPYCSDGTNTSNQLHPKEQQVDEPHNEPDLSQKIEKENSLPSADWDSFKSFKWSRSGSLTSKGSSLTFSSNSKNADESCDLKVELPLKIATPDESSSGDAVGCLASPTSLEDTGSRKKPRLGWGEGLAKFEKKIGPDDYQMKNSSMELMPSPTPYLAESRSPVTPSSAACTSSPGLEDKSYTKAVEIVSDSYNLSPSPTLRSRNHLQEISLSPESMELKPNYNSNGLLTELHQNDYLDLELIKTAGVNKLELFSGEISKALVLTQSEIDSLENELKSLKSEPGNSSRCPEPSSSMPLISKEKSGSGDIVVEDTVPNGNIIEESHAEGKDEYVDSPGTATSKFMEYEVSTSDEVAKDGNAPGHENLVVSDIMEESEACKILASNKEAAAGASNLLSNFLPCSSCSVQSVETISPRCTPNNLIVKERFLKRKHSVMFKERALCLKYRVLQYQWKEDLQLFCERKSQKKVESGYRSSHGGPQKHRSSIRLQAVSPASSSSMLLKPEVVSFASKLLSDPQIRSYRNYVKMPPLMLDKTEKELSKFLSNNGLVENPCELEKEKALVNPWTPEEKEIFLDKYATHGKDFKKISSYLDLKSTADCVKFYYKNQKSSLFKNIKQHKKLKKQEKSAVKTRYLMTSGKKNQSSLDMLGAVSAIVAKESKSVKLRLNGTVREVSRSFYDNMEDERETEAADALASICCSMSSEATSSYITLNVEDEETCSDDDSCGYMEENVDWTDEEKSRFLQAFLSYGKDFVMISQCVGTKSRDQCRIFFGKAKKCLGLDELLLRPRSDVMEDDVAASPGGSSGTTDEKDPPMNSLSLNPGMVEEDELKTRSHDLVSLKVVIPE